MPRHPRDRRDDQIPLPRGSTAQHLTRQAGECLSELATIIRQLERLLSQTPSDTTHSNVDAYTTVGDPQVVAARLTVREHEVLQLLIQGLSNRRIARALGISEPTVKNHLHAVFLKLDVGDRTQAIAKMLRPPNG